MGTCVLAEQPGLRRSRSAWSVHMPTPELSWGVCDEAMPITISAIPDTFRQAGGRVAFTLESGQGPVNGCPRAISRLCRGDKQALRPLCQSARRLRTGARQRVSHFGDSHSIEPDPQG